MVISAECMVAQANTCLTAVNSVCSIAQLIGVNTNLNNVPYAVANLAALPNATCNTGRFVYVSDIGAYRFSDGTSWVRDFSTDCLIANVLAWGENNCGQLGDNSTTNRSSPVMAAGGYTRNWCEVSTSYQHTAAVKTDGTLWTWGNNTNGRLGDVNAVSRSSPGTTTSGGTDWCTVSAGRYHTAAVKTGGTLWTWGFNACGQLGDSTVTNRCSPGTVAGGGSWCRVSAGTAHTVAVKSGGTLWAWGCNTTGALGDISTTNRSSPVEVAGGFSIWCQVSAGNGSTAAVQTNCCLWTWGSNSVCQLGDGTATSRSSPGAVVGAGTTWCQASAGAAHMAAVKCDGTIWTWGNNASGQLGDSSVTNRSSPVQVAGSNTLWCQVSAGGSHTAGVKTDGTLWTWGYNGSGRLGNNTTTNRSSPGAVVGTLSPWCAVSAGTNNTVGIVGA
jgi:alpha-tubulin suppressor-like RCC1 family protein